MARPVVIAAASVGPRLEPGESWPFLAELSSEARARVLASTTVAKLSFGATLARQDDAADAVFLVLAGRVRLTARSGADDEVTVGRLEPGHAIGDVQVTDRARWSYTIRSSTETTIASLDADSFRALLDSDGALRDYVGIRRSHELLRATFGSACPAFETLSADTIVHLAATGPFVRRAACDEPLCRPGDPLDRVYAVKTGRLRMTWPSIAERPAVRLVETGQFAVTGVALARGFSDASVEAIDAAELVALRREGLVRLLNALPDLKAVLADMPTVSAAAVEGPVGLRSVEDEPRSVDHTDRHRRWRSVPLVRQIDENDCGAACLAMVLRHHGRDVPLAAIRRRLAADRDGSSLGSVCSTADDFGLAARALKVSPDNVANLPLPAICHWDGNHWVVLERLRRRRAVIADPGSGRRTIPIDELHRRWNGYAALFENTGLTLDPDSARSVGRGWLATLIAPHVSALARAAALALIVSALEMSLPLFTQLVLDRALVEGEPTFLTLLTVAMGCAMGFSVLALIVQRYLVAFVAVRLDTGALDVIAQRLLALPLSYFAARRTGDLQRRLEGVRQMRDLALHSAVTVLTGLAHVLPAFAMVALYSPRMGLYFAVLLPLYAVIMLGGGRRLRRRFADLEDAYGHYHAYLVDAIKGIETVKATASEPVFRSAMLEEFNRLGRQVFKTDLAVLSFEGAIETLSFAGLGFFVWAGAREALAGAITIGAFVGINALVSLALVSLRSMALVWNQAQRARVLLDRLDDVVTHEPEQGPDRSGLKTVSSLQGHISVRGLTFRQADPSAPPILDDISFDISPGMRVAIVGPSGSGKSTLVKCLTGLAEPTGGTVLYDGLDLRRLNHRALRRHIGFVLQDSYLFAGTIAGNIACGDLAPDPERIAWAASVGHADEFIRRLPLGYETRVGETGLALSAGECQRIAIARAVYGRPPVLLFDEPTSALDTESERLVQIRLAPLLEGRTSIVIAHRLSTIRDADLILVMDRGRVVERGTHAELTGRNGRYTQLVARQMEVVA